jgi:hypothetical protein
MVRYTLCSFCKHRHARQPSCAAYPERIPAEFLTGQRQHVLPAEGDHGIQFEMADDLDEGSRRLALHMVATVKAKAAKSSSAPAESA